MFVKLAIQLFIFLISHYWWFIHASVWLHHCLCPNSLLQILLSFTIHPSVKQFPNAPTLSLFPSLLWTLKAFVVPVLIWPEEDIALWWQHFLSLYPQSKDCSCGWQWCWPTLCKLPFQFVINWKYTSFIITVWCMFKHHEIDPLKSLLITDFKPVSYRFGLIGICLSVAKCN